MLEGDALLQQPSNQPISQHKAYGNKVNPGETMVNDKCFTLLCLASPGSL